MISKRILAFASAVLFLFVGCPLLFDTPFPPFPLLHGADLIEFATPFVIVPAYWWLFEGAGVAPPGRRQILVFVLLTTLWVIGIGVHVAGNSIQHLMDQGTRSSAYELARFFHKPLSHYVQSIALMGLSSALIYRERVQGTSERQALRLEGLAALLYGFAFFCLNVSGKIAPLGIVYSIALVAYGIKDAARLRARPMLAFFLMAQALYLVLCIGWWIFWRGMPNFSETGFIK
jgi:hypothetical protein